MMDLVQRLSCALQEKKNIFGILKGVSVYETEICKKCVHFRQILYPYCHEYNHWSYQDQIKWVKKYFPKLKEEVDQRIAYLKQLNEECKEEAANGESSPKPGNA
ncbi:hypothetical protein RF11_11574 [Thelohanellus kitauei]|uniref:Uncharacterized protein n=1 Tax=Thelohanellus kitauei TaxID=669202 RepID=A0A0C2JLI5_THEKT|nr:hypothetical protein RF11_11574 [Thelohanellus kitauei]